MHHVARHRRGTDHEDLANLVWGPADRQQTEHLSLSRRQGSERGSAAGSSWHGVRPAEELAYCVKQQRRLPERRSGRPRWERYVASAREPFVEGRQERYGDKSAWKSRAADNSHVADREPPSGAASSWRLDPVAGGRRSRPGVASAGLRDVVVMRAPPIADRRYITTIGTR
jgi:hypothetical protein